MIPTEEHLAAGELAIAVDLGLEAQIEFLLLESAAQSGLEQVALFRAQDGRLGGALDRIAAAALGFHHGAGGLAEQGDGVGSIDGIKAEAGAGGKENVARAEAQLAAEDAEQGFGGFQGLADVGDGIEEDAEFIAAEAGDGAAAGPGLEAAGDLEQGLVAGAVAEQFVEMAETVDAKDDDRKAVFGAGAGQNALGDGAFDLRPAHQTG